MNKKISRFFVSALLATVVLGACAPTPATVAPKQEPTKGSEALPAATKEGEKPAAATEVKDQPTTAAPAGSVLINGAGATFPLPLYMEWTYMYQTVDPSVTINYQGIGSGGGKKGIIDGTIDFAGSDSLVKDEEYTQGKDLQMYPVVAGAVVPIYNVKFNGDKTSTVVLDRQVLVGIFNATVKKWNDPAILALNPDLKDALPDADITVVHRSDGSGTTELFTMSLASFSEEWKAGAASSIEWPVDKAGKGIGGKGNPGVAAAVQSTPNSIGYVELSYAIANKISYVKMVNKAGKTVEANAESLSSAMADFSDKFSDKLTNTIVDAPGEKSWPIAGYTYLILHTQSMKDSQKAEKLLQYITWSISDESAAKKAAELGYAVLPETVQKTVAAKLKEVTCDGKPVLK